MIFLTLGTNHPFDRMLRIVDRWCGENPGETVFGQIYADPAGGYRPKNFEWVTHLAPEPYHRRMMEARFVVAHAGMGSIITALCLSKPILLFPRRAALNEQRNDHQLATVERWRTVPGVFAALDEAELLAGMDRLASEPVAGPARELGPYASARLTDSLQAAIREGRAKRADGRRRKLPWPTGASLRLTPRS